MGLLATKPKPPRTYSIVRAPMSDGDGKIIGEIEYIVTPGGRVSHDTRRWVQIERPAQTRTPRTRTQRRASYASHERTVRQRVRVRGRMDQENRYPLYDRSAGYDRYFHV